MHALRFNRLTVDELLAVARAHQARLHDHARDEVRAWGGRVATCVRGWEDARDAELRARRHLSEARDRRRDDEDSLRQLLTALHSDVGPLPTDLAALLDLPAAALADALAPVVAWMRGLAGVDARRVTAAAARTAALVEHAAQEQTAARAHVDALAGMAAAEEELRRRLAASAYVLRGLMDADALFPAPEAQ
ncbi:MAG: hypothetical protein HY904_25840 [Deltaproteobacteria bacterium]|nr:hypothetical protein [Deltaproteobacteria bacterium]